MKYVWITGATGFIGLHLLKKISKYECIIICFVRNLDVQLPNGVIKISTSLANDEILTLLEKYPPKCIFHLATLYQANHTLGEEQDLIESNINFGVKILELLRFQNIKNLPFLNISTSWTHLHNNDYLPANLYAATKEAFLCLLRYYANEKIVNVLTLELCDTYGPGDKRKKIIYLFLNAIAKEEVIDLTPGEQVVNVMHVDDVADAMIFAMELLIRDLGTWSRYSIGASEKYTLKDIGKIVENITGSSGYFNFGGKPYRENEVMIPPSFTPELPNWHPKIDLIKGLTELYKVEFEEKF